MKKLFALLLAVLTVTSSLAALSAVYAEGGGTEPAAKFETAAISVPLDDIKALDTSKYKSLSSVLPSIKAKIVARETTFVFDIVYPNADLDEMLQKIYDYVTKHTGKSSEGDYLLSIISDMRASSSYYPVSGTCYHEITFTVKYMTPLGDETAFKNGLKEVYNSFGFTDKTSVYEKIRKIYEYVCSNVTYDTAYNTAWSAFNNKRSACLGYASLLYRMLLDQGIDSRIIVGTLDVSDNVKHAWNVVRIDGQYYYLDATLDNGSGTDWAWFLRSAADFTQHTADNSKYDSAFFSKYPIAKKSFDPSTDPAVNNPFTDMAAGAYYYLPVLWAVDGNITSGTDKMKFSPDSYCTRGQIVTFLWRANGSPEPSLTQNNFVDVKPGDYFYKAVLWAVEQGITQGVTATIFAPDDICTRAQTVTFLYRSAGNPNPYASENPFKDVKTSDYYGPATLWAVRNEITVGTDKTHFSPEDKCTRAQIVTFLYRDLFPLGKIVGGTYYNEWIGCKFPLDGYSVQSEKDMYYSDSRGVLMASSSGKVLEIIYYYSKDYEEMKKTKTNEQLVEGVKEDLKDAFLGTADAFDFESTTDVRTETVSGRKFVVLETVFATGGAYYKAFISGTEVDGRFVIIVGLVSSSSYDSFPTNPISEVGFSAK